MNSLYKQNIQTIASEDSFMPKGIRYALRAYLGGARRRMINVQSMVSSIFDLEDTLKRQTAEYQRDFEKQMEQGQQAAQQPFSSEWITKQLNIQNEENEQLEGSLLLKLSRAHRMFSFTNNTIEKLPESEYFS